MSVGDLFVSDSPMNLLQNLEGKESILGRSIVIYKVDQTDINFTNSVEKLLLPDPLACCIIDRDAVPSGSGPKPKQNDILYIIITAKFHYFTYKLI